MVRQPACALALAWRLTRGFANGLIEGIHSPMQAAKVKARGYRSPRDLEAIIYLLAGMLDPWRPA